MIAGFRVPVHPRCTLRKVAHSPPIGSLRTRRRPRSSTTTLLRRDPALPRRGSRGAAPPAARAGALSHDGAARTTAAARSATTTPGLSRSRYPRRQQRAPAASATDDRVAIGGLETVVAHMNGVVTRPSKKLRHERRKRVVDQEPQPAAASGKLTLAHGLGGEMQCLVDVLSFEIGVGAEDLLTTHAVGDHLDDGRHRDPREPHPRAFLIGCSASSLLNQQTRGQTGEHHAPAVECTSVPALTGPTQVGTSSGAGRVPLSSSDQAVSATAARTAPITASVRASSPKRTRPWLKPRATTTAPGIVEQSCGGVHELLDERRDAAAPKGSQGSVRRHGARP